MELTLTEQFIRDNPSELTNLIKLLSQNTSDVINKRITELLLSNIPSAKWHTIDSAPKDGTEVLLAVEMRAGIPKGVLVGHYMGGGHCIEGHPPISAGWYFWNGCMFDEAAKPTHWSPLPNHPNWDKDSWQADHNKGTGQFYGIIDPDYAKIFTVARCIAWSDGYSVSAQGSFTRDLDLLIVPWTENAKKETDVVIRRIADSAGLKIHHSPPTVKPHGRLAYTLLLPGFSDPRFVDISIFQPTQVSEQTNGNVGSSEQQA